MFVEDIEIGVYLYVITVFKTMQKKFKDPSQTFDAKFKIIL